MILNLLHSTCITIYWLNQQINFYSVGHVTYHLPDRVYTGLLDIVIIDLWQYNINLTNHDIIIITEAKATGWWLIVYFTCDVTVGNISVYLDITCAIII